MHKMNSNIYNYLILSIVAFFVLFLNSMNWNAWGYDEYAALVSHIELDDEKFINTYISLLKDLGIQGKVFEDLLKIVLGIFVVPIRWTYSIGISPLYGIIRIDSLNWFVAYKIISIAHITVSVLGFLMICSVLHRNHSKILFGLMMLSFMCVSSTFMYWHDTYTSYALHLLGYGAFVVSVKISLMKSKANIWLVNFVRCLPIIASYQYLPVITLLGLLELFRSRSEFFRSGLYKGWIGPSLLAVLSIFFIMLRSSYTGGERSISYNFDNAQLYAFNFAALVGLDEANNWTFFLERLVDILKYLFVIQAHDEIFMISDYTRLSNTFAGIFAAMIMVTIFWLRRTFHSGSQSDKILILSASSVLSIQFGLYMFGVLPMSPSRHSLIIFLPICTLITLITMKIFNKMHHGPVKILIFCLGLCAAIIYQRQYFDFGPIAMDTTKAVYCIEEANISDVILERCYLEPIVQNRNSEFLYSCGSRVFNSVDGTNQYFALLTRDVPQSEIVVSTLKDYVDKKWKVNTQKTSEVLQCVDETFDDSSNALRAPSVTIFENSGM